jgi:carboxylate-amine ligase
VRHEAEVLLFPGSLRAPWPIGHVAHVPCQVPGDHLPTDRFGSSPPFRLGVEEELMLVDPETHELAHATDEVLRRAPRSGRGAVVGEICDGVVELLTPVCATAAEAVATLAALRRRAVRPGGPVLLGAGVHPTQPFGDVRHRGGDHYAAVLADTRGVLAQSVYCGVHVHVGMPDAETAVAAYNGLRRWVPVLQALGASSPFWHGRDSGMASCRTIRLHSLPRTGVPRAFADWADYSAAMRQLLRGSDADGLGALWWDVRPHPTLGTLEIRALDGQSSLADLEGLVALAHCLAVHAACSVGDDHPPKEVLDEATFRAVRDGLEARLSVGGPMRHVRDLARHALEIAAGYAVRLRCTDSLGHVERLLAEGNGADRQRRAFAAGGLPAVVRALVRETAASAAPPAQRGTPVCSGAA